MNIKNLGSLLFHLPMISPHPAPFRAGQVFAGWYLSVKCQRKGPVSKCLGDLILSSGPFPRLTGGVSGNTLNPTGPGRRNGGRRKERLLLKEKYIWLSHERVPLGE